MNITRREFLRLAGAFTASACIASPAFGEEAVAIPVLLYHDISDAFRDPHTVSPSFFAAQLEWLYNDGYRVIPLREISNPPAHDKLAVITFDDGYTSFIEYAFPLLKEYGFCATINVIGELVGKYIPEGANSSRPLLSWDEYRHLLKSGVVDIGCHAHALHVSAHKGMLDVSDEALRQDLRMFLETLWKETGTKTDILAWPYGFYDARIINIAEQEGFRYLQTTRQAFFNTPGNFSEIPRKNINNRHNLVAFRIGVTS